MNNEKNPVGGGVGLKKSKILPKEIVDINKKKVKGLTMFNKEVGKTNGNLALKVTGHIKTSKIVNSPIPSLSKQLTKKKGASDE